tara:strand:- start:489 stop:989 length:501 start_codon:yes stop_codon:yes gene_type:complete
MAKEKPSKMRKKIHDLCEENEFYSIKQNRNRARSITVGTAFGGVVEVNMRSDAGSVYAQMQPIEAIELIEQIAAGVGVEIAMRPKNNFASWRGWEEVIGQRVPLEHIAWKGAAAWQFDAKDPEPKQLEAEKETKQLKAEETKKSEEESIKKPRRTRKRKTKEIENE